MDLAAKKHDLKRKMEILDGTIKVLERRAKTFPVEYRQGLESDIIKAQQERANAFIELRDLPT